MPTLFHRPPGRRRAMRLTSLLMAAVVVCLISLCTGCGGGDPEDGPDTPPPESPCGIKVEGQRDPCVL